MMTSLSGNLLPGMVAMIFLETCRYCREGGRQVSLSPLFWLADGFPRTQQRNHHLGVPEPRRSKDPIGFRWLYRGDQICHHRW
jgi:hypothetical protein